LLVVSASVSEPVCAILRGAQHAALVDWSGGSSGTHKSNAARDERA
jgi:hypothetical protein